MEFDLEADRQGFIAHRVLPVFETMKAAGTFGRVTIASLLASRETKRAAGGGYSRSKWQFDDDSFATKEHGAEEPVDDNEAAMYADYFDMELISAKRAMDAVLRNAEIRASDLIFNTTTWTGAALTTAVAIPWSTYATAVPINNVEAAVQKMWDGSGLWANTLVITKKVFRNLRLCAQIIDRIAASGAGSRVEPSKITEQMLADCFDLEQVIVAGSGKNTAIEGQTPAISPVWSSSYAMVCKVAKGNDIAEPCIGRTFHWGEDGSQIGGLVETYREEQIRGDVVRVRHQVHEKVLHEEAGHLLSNIT